MTSNTMTGNQTPVPPTWPDESRFSVAVTVNFDGESLLLAADPTFGQREKSLSIMRYAINRGVDRFLETFADKGVTTTWFVPGLMAESEPSLVRDIAAAGHAIAARGYALERFDNLGDEARYQQVSRGISLIEEATNSPVDGFRLPSGEWPIDFSRVLRDCGLTWSSSFYGDDLPFFLPGAAGDQLVDIPISYGLDDRVAFFWNYNPPMPPGQARISSYAEVLQNWLYELEGCRREGLCFVIQLHPEICGTPGKISIVRDLLDAINESGDAYVDTCGGIAHWWRSQGHANAASHPIEMFEKLRISHP